MCTVTFVPHGPGYRLGVNRDERITREPALPPAIFEAGGLRAVYPHESGGGTWLAGSERGITLTLLNWTVGERQAQQRSRGEIIPRLIAQADLASARMLMRQVDLAGVEPFRLVGVFLRQSAVCEWRWDRQSISDELFPWEARHWFSSGLSDEAAAQQRGTVTEAAWKEDSAGSLDWMRRLHQSHIPAAGPFSICVHREDARTVSYSEVETDASSLTLCYQPGPPCTPEDAPACLTLPIR
jgi:hypothetical protein